MVGGEAGRRDMLPRDRPRGGQAGMGQGGRQDGGRADEGAPCVRACVGALIDVGMVGGCGDAWRTGGRRFACVRQRRWLVRGQAPRKKGGGVGRGRPAYLEYEKGEHVCTCVGTDAPRPSVHPLGRV
jgi:hypothetical protein